MKVERITAHVHVPDGRDFQSYKRLASSVLNLAFADGERGPCGAECSDARRFLCEDSELLRLWCRWLNVHPDWIRAEARNRGWCGVGMKEREGDYERMELGGN